MPLFFSQTFGRIYLMPNSGFKPLKIIGAFKKVGFSLILLILSANFIKNTFQVMQSDTRFEELSAHVEGLKEQKVKDSATLKYKQTPDYIEQEARIKLNLIKPNEKLFVVPESLTVDSTVVLGENIALQLPEEPESNLAAWLALIF